MKRTIDFILRRGLWTAGLLLCLAGASSCEKLLGGYPVEIPEAATLDKVAALLSSLPLETEHFQEVYTAVGASSGNGYDEEYTMADLFLSPGKGVGDSDAKAAQTKAALTRSGNSRPLRELIRDYVTSASSATKAGGAEMDFGDDPEEWLSALEDSDVQIYWPYSEDWDGETAPVFTFDPGDDSDINVGYRVVQEEDGERRIERIDVTEDFARKNPVWVVNRNSDCGYTSLDVLRREHPEWDNGGGALIIGGKALSSAGTAPCSEASSDGASIGAAPTKAPVTKTGGTGLRTLMIKEFTMQRHYDCWFAGGSEFFVKAGSVDDFSASTEAELRLYSPAITDFMVVVKRKQLGEALPLNAVIVSDWSEDVERIAFMITEDDGGTVSQWKCSAVVKVASKSYGFDISLPFNSRDDIVWRGQLSRRYIEATENVSGHFGGVDITFQVLNYELE